MSTNLIAYTYLTLNECLIWFSITFFLGRLRVKKFEKNIGWSWFFYQLTMIPLTIFARKIAITSVTHNTETLTFIGVYLVFWVANLVYWRVRFGPDQFTVIGLSAWTAIPPALVCIGGIAICA